MSNKVTNSENSLVLSRDNAITSRSSNLIKRGLSDLPNVNTTPEAIAEARKTKREFRGLSDETIKIAITKPPSWEHLLYLHTFADTIDGYESIRQSLALGLTPTDAEPLTIGDTIAWIQKSIGKLGNALKTADHLYQSDLEDAMGKPGEAGDVDNIILFVRRVCLNYKELLDLRLQCETIEKDYLFDEIFRIMLSTLHININAFEAYGPDNIILLEKILSAPDTGEKKKLSMTLSLNADLVGFSEEIDRITPITLQRLTRRHN